MRIGTSYQLISLLSLLVSPWACDFGQGTDAISRDELNLSISETQADPEDSGLSDLASVESCTSLTLHSQQCSDLGGCPNRTVNKVLFEGVCVTRQRKTIDNQPKYSCGCSTGKKLSPPSTATVEISIAE